jgi:hypothetical protein
MNESNNNHETANGTKPVLSAAFHLLEYEKAEFLTLVESVKALMSDGEQIYYRQAFRWRNSEGEPQSNCYEMFPAESIANAKGLKIIRQYGEHIFIGVSV